MEGRGDRKRTRELERSAVARRDAVVWIWEIDPAQLGFISTERAGPSSDNALTTTTHISLSSTILVLIHLVSIARTSLGVIVHPLPTGEPSSKWSCNPAPAHQSVKQSSRLHSTRRHVRVSTHSLALTRTRGRRAFFRTSPSPPQTGLQLGRVSRSGVPPFGPAQGRLPRGHQ